MTGSYLSRTLALVAVTASLAAGCGRSVDRSLDPANELPRGVIDTPAPGTVLRPGPTLVGGWALDDTGVVEVRIYFDGRYVARTSLLVPRPDVAQAFPAYARPGDLYGWNTEIDFAATDADHVILAQAVDANGATRDIGAVAVKGHR